MKAQRGPKTPKRTKPTKRENNETNRNKRKSSRAQQQKKKDDEGAKLPELGEKPRKTDGRNPQAPLSANLRTSMTARPNRTTPYEAKRSWCALRMEKITKNVKRENVEKRNPAHWYPKTDKKDQKSDYNSQKTASSADMSGLSGDARRGRTNHGPLAPTCTIMVHHAPTKSDEKVGRSKKATKKITKTMHSDNDRQQRVS